MDAGFALGWVVDPGNGRQLGWAGSMMSESGGVDVVGGVEGAGSLLTDFCGGAVAMCRPVWHSRGVQELGQDRHAAHIIASFVAGASR